MILTKFSVSDAHVALQEVIHLLYRLLLKFCWLQKTKIIISFIHYLSFITNPISREARTFSKMQ